MNKSCCKALFISALSSGQGKTTITCGLSRYLYNQGFKVKVFKTGPDYLDPFMLEHASKCSVESLDLWMAGEAYCRQQLYQAASNYDFILVEGAMGLMDGSPSSAELAEHFNIPILVVINAKGMAQTLHAVTFGLSTYSSNYPIHGFIINQLGSQRHQTLIEESDQSKSLPNVCFLKRDDHITLPERHLGLVQAHEFTQKELEKRLESAAHWISQSTLPQWIQENTANISIDFSYDDHRIKTQECFTSKPLSGHVVAVAKDEAFSFIYDVNCKTLMDLGAEIQYFSPIHDKTLPENTSSIWLPGGYPELYGEQLSANTGMRHEITQAFIQEKPILAECGGMLYLQQSLTTIAGKCHNMVGALEGYGMMKGKRGCQGMQTAPLPEGAIRGHSHHRSYSESQSQPFCFGIRQRHSAPGEPIFREKRLTASYLHLFFPSNPVAVAQLFRAH